LAIITTSDTDITLWTGGGTHQQVDFGQEFNVISHINRTWFGEILMRIFGKSDQYFMQRKIETRNKTVTKITKKLKQGCNQRVRNANH
jgi:hypothetical protein